MFGTRYGNGDTCFTVTDFSVPHGVTWCTPLMVLEFIYCRRIPTVLIVHHITQFGFFLSGLFLGDQFPVERRDISFKKSIQNCPGDHPACRNEYRAFTGGDEWVKRLSSSGPSRQVIERNFLYLVVYYSPYRKTLRLKL